MSAKIFAFICWIFFSWTVTFVFCDEEQNGIKGIDVSHWQGKIDWTKVKAAGIKYAILRTTVKGELDDVFAYNYKNAKANGIVIMGYHYSYSLSDAAAIEAATNLVTKLNGIKFPIYIDLEWDQQGALGKKAVTSIAKNFILTLQKAGYEANVYSNKNWYNNFYYPDELRNLGCKFWIASYGKNTGEMDTKYKPNVGEYIWQYTSKGKVSGISGNVDLDMLYGSL